MISESAKLSLAFEEFNVPYRHFRANNFLSPEAYSELEKNYRHLLALSDSVTDSSPQKFKKSRLKYDAVMRQINSEIATLFTPFLNEPFLRSLYNFLGMPYLPMVHTGVHCNHKNSRNGWLHTDHCSGWFDQSQQTNGTIHYQADSNCDYFTGSPKNEHTEPVEYIRSATFLFYFCNDGWQPGDGGETALYESPEADLNYPHAFIEPRNNTALLFECTPYSYHQFIANPGMTRNSFILGLHSTVAFAESIWHDQIKRRNASIVPE